MVYGSPSCAARVAVGSGLALGRCGCPGYTTDAATYGEPVEIVDVAKPRLRLAGESRSVVPSRVSSRICRGRPGAYCAAMSDERFENAQPSWERMRARSRGSVVRLALAYAALSGLLLALDALALRYLPASTVHLHSSPLVTRARWLFVLLPPIWFAAAPLLPGRLLRCEITLILAGATSNLLAMRVFGGAPDYLVLRRGISFGSTATWQAHRAFFNVGDLSIPLGLCLLPFVILSGGRALDPGEVAVRA